MAAGTDVSLTLSFTAPASSTGSSLVADGSTLLAETAVSCPCVVSTLDGTVLVDSTSCKAVGGTVTVSIPATSTGIVATCLPTGEGYIGAVCTTDAVTADMSCSVDSRTTTSLGTYLATCEEAAGSACLDPATGKPTGSLVIPNVTASCLVGALGETVDKGDSTASGGKKCGALLATVMQQVIASGGDPAGFIAKLFSGDATAAAQATAAGLSSSDIDLCKGMKNFYKTFASDSTCTTSGSVDTAANAAFNITSSSDFDTVNKTSWSAFSNVISGFKATDLSTSNMQAVVGLISQSLAAGGTNTSFTAAGLGDAIKNIFNASTEVTDFRLLGKAIGTTFIKGGIAPTTLRDHSDIWSQYLKGNITSLSGNSPSATAINSIGTVNSVINGATAGTKLDLSSRKICSSAADCAGTATPVCSGNVCLSQTEQGYGKTGGATLGGTASRGTSCTKDDDCSVGLACNSSVCSLPCRTSSDCSSLGSGATCASNFCLLAAAGGTCAATTECQSGLLCLGTSASTKTCKSSGVAGDICSANTDCGSGLVCTSNLCATPATTLVANVNRAGQPGSLQCDSSACYYIENFNTANTVNIKSVPLTGGSVTSIVSNASDARALRIVGSNLYWSVRNLSDSSQNAIMAKAKDGSGSVNQVCTNAIAADNNFVTDGTSFYWGDAMASGKIYKIAVSTSNGNCNNGGTAVASSLDTAMVKLLQGTTVYFLNTANTPTLLQKVSTGGGSTSTVATFTGTARSMPVVSDGTSLCWIDQQGGLPPVANVNCMPVAGGSITTVMTNVTAMSLAVSGGSVYIGTTPSGGVAGKLLKISVSGGTPTTLLTAAAATGSIGDIQIVGSKIFYFDGNSQSTSDLKSFPLP